VKKALLISPLIILGIGVLLNNCGGDDRAQCDALCHVFCQRYSECIVPKTTSELNQCEQNCRDEIEKPLTNNACENIMNNVVGMNCTGFRRYLSGCSDECSTSGSKVCSGKGYKTCGYNDSNGCFELSSVTNCGSSELCLEGNCIQTYPSNITLGINNLCYNGDLVKYRYFGLISGDVWPSSDISGDMWPSSGYYSYENNKYDNNVYTSNITCLVEDNICLGGASESDLVLCVGIHNQMYTYSPSCCVSCTDGLNHIWDITCN